MRTRWYKDAVIYQIYPRSFCDSNGDGIGDLKGITSKLDYLKDLGITAVWLSPCYKSPNDDNGYDISDYRNIMDDFGTMADFKEMLSEMHKRDIKLVMDLVANHTSDEHRWFQESKKSKENPYRDYYVWKKGRGKFGKLPPNNWTSRFGGSAWKYDETTNEFYLHLFSKKQPDLNWDNPKVRQEIADICNFWFDIGVDGFRCDVITYISKSTYQNGKLKNPFLVGDEHFVVGKNYHNYIHELYEKSWSKYDVMTVGEAPMVKVDEAEDMIGENRGELDTIFSFELQDTDSFFTIIPKRKNLVKFKKVLFAWQRLSDNCWPTLFLENHDIPRAIPRYVSYKGRVRGSKMLAVAMNFLKGTPYIFQGQEIGMTNIEDFHIEDCKDVVSQNVHNVTKRFMPILKSVAVKVLSKRARDHARTPMQWNKTKNAGFSFVKPWMIVNKNYKKINVEDEQNNPNSILNFYKKLIRLRIGNEIIRYGSFESFYEKEKNVLMYARQFENVCYLVVCNFSEKKVDFEIPQKFQNKKASVLLSNINKKRKFESGMLGSLETVVWKIDMD